jgi:endonuclease/exonuclease/phosphatase family metal-dependent hydrolase
VGTDLRRDPLRIMEIIGSLQADIVILQEADLRLGKRVSALPLDQVQDRTGLVSVGASGNTHGIGWHGNAILVRHDIAVKSLERMDLPGIEPRGAVIAELRIDQRPLRVVGVHLGLMRTSRRQQLDALNARFKSMGSVPTILAGDLNEWSGKVGLGRLTPHFTLHAPGKTFHAKMPVAALDRIALDDHFATSGGGVLDTRKTRAASDHLPIWLDVTFRH